MDCLQESQLKQVINTLKNRNMKTHKKVLKVDNLANFEFWLGMFRPRTKKWQKETLKRLKAGKDNPFANTEEAGDKIKALEFLLNG